MVTVAFFGADTLITGAFVPGRAVTTAGGVDCAAAVPPPLFVVLALLLLCVFGLPVETTTGGGEPPPGCCGFVVVDTPCGPAAHAAPVAGLKSVKTLMPGLPFHRVPTFSARRLTQSVAIESVSRTPA